MKVSRETLSPGDLCVIINAGYLRPEHRYVIGRTVVLIEIVVCQEHFAPFWRCCGIPSSIAVSHQILRRIPPVDLIEARMHSEPVNEFHNKEMKVWLESIS